MNNTITLKTISTPLFDATLEKLAKNVHDQWMAGRIACGWKYGTGRNDQKKEHPSLIPYEELSEEEKEYDRQTALTTLKYFLENGYEIIQVEKK